MTDEIRKQKNIITVDCREMEPPNPMLSVLEAVEKMNKDDVVCMLHRKNPIPLYEKLVERGLHYDLKELEGGHIELLIWKE
ncbi:MAG: DUF2249 domain-containing protein [Nitrospinae bacterium]|nr:DUF2249 domain-containing protein [Nitrospinota bacterium]